MLSPLKFKVKDEVTVQLMVGRPVSQSISPSVSQSVSQSVSRSFIHSFIRSISLSVSQSINQSLHRNPTGCHGQISVDELNVRLRQSSRFLCGQTAPTVRCLKEQTLSVVLYTYIDLNFAFLGAFAKLRNAAISFVIYAPLTVRPHATTRILRDDFHEIWYLNIFFENLSRNPNLIKSYKNNKYLIGIPMHIYDSILLNWGLGYRSG